jgi:endonuclease VIII
VPEGDALHRAATRLTVLAGEVVSAESPHPRAAALGVAERIDGKRLEQVEAIGKNLLLTFEGGLVVRSHLRMSGRWRVQPAGSRIRGRPWLVLRGREHEAVLFNGPVLQLMRPGSGRAEVAIRGLGPDVMLDPPDLDGMLERLRATDQERDVGEALLDQRLVAGIGNKWKAEGLSLAGVSPWARLTDVSNEELTRVLDETSRAMRGARRSNVVYRRAGMGCRRCGATVRSWPQGEDARIAYWCPTCQRGPAGEARPAPPDGVQAGTGRASA